MVVVVVVMMMMMIDDDDGGGGGDGDGDDEDDDVDVCDRAGRDTRRPKVLYQPSSTRYHRQSSTEVSAMCYHC